MSALRTSVALSLLSTVGLAGACAVPRSTFVQPTGQPLLVKETAERGTYVEQVETGGVKDADGNVIAKTYENRERSYVKYETVLTQGGQKIDAESFVRIAGAADGATMYDAYHDNGMRRHKLGVIILGAGAAAIGGGLLLSAVSENPSGIGITATSLGISAAGLGGFFAFMGKRVAEDTAPPAEVAGDCQWYLAIAQTYNQNLPGGAGVPAGSCIR